MRKVILAIRPKWAELILNRKKTVEIRRRIWRNFYEPVKIYLYATAPVQKIVGEVEGVVLPGGATKRAVSLEGTFLSFDDAVEYLAGAQNIYRITLSRPRRYSKPVLLSEMGAKRAPQNFIYVPNKKRGPKAS